MVAIGDKKRVKYAFCLAVALFGINFSVFAADKITVGALRFTSHAPSFIAFERDYFKKAGLDVEFEFFQAAQPMALAVAAGDVDYAVTATTGGLISLAEKGVVKIIGGALSEEVGIDGSLIVVSDAAFKSGVTHPSHLDGKTWGITQSGSSFHYMGAQVAKKEGISVKFKPMPKVSVMLGSIQSAQIDAVAIVPNVAKALVKNGSVHIIGAIADYIPNYQITTIFTASENALSNRSETERFLNAYSQGVSDFNAALVDKIVSEQQTEAMIKLIHKYVYTDRTYEEAALSIQNGAMRINPGAALNFTSINDQLHWFQSKKLIKDSITVNDLIDDSYVKIVR